MSDPSGPDADNATMIAVVLNPDDAATSCAAHFGVTDGGVRISARESTLNLDDAQLRGLEYRDSELVLHVEGGRVVLGGSPLLAGAATTLIGRLCVIPETMRGLRALGARAGASTREHDVFLEPLLTARRKGEMSGDPTGRLSAFDAVQLRTAVDATIVSLAKGRFPADSPERRSLEEMLRDAALPLVSALDELERSGAGVKDKGDAFLFESWRNWCVAVAHVFTAADRAWISMQPVLESSGSAPKPGLFSRLFRAGASAVLLVLCASDAAAQTRMVRISGVSIDSVRARDFDVTSQIGADVIVAAGATDVQRLVALGWSFSEMPSGVLRPALDPRYATTEGNIYRSYDDAERGVRFFMDSIARANPRVHLDTIGRTFEGRPMLAAKIGARDDSPARPNVLFMATYHAREWAATEMAMRLLKHLANTTSEDARVDSLIRNRDIWIIPVVNADGYEYTFNVDRLWRKNRHPADFGGSVGVDLNRNHSYRWALDNAGSSSNPLSETYRGTAAASEPETRAVEDFHRRHPPVTAISYHTYTGLLLYPPGNTFGVLPGDLSIFRTLAGEGTNSAVRDNLPGALNPFYHPGPGWNLYTTNGEYTDWAYATHGTLAFTPELTSGYENGDFYGFVFPEDEMRLQTLFQDNLPFALDLIEAARSPHTYASPTTGLEPARIVLESISPVVRVRLPASRIGSSTVSTSQPLTMRLDQNGAGHYSKRLISGQVQRPATVTVVSSGVEADFSVLAVNGAEATDVAWQAVGFVNDTGGVAGTRKWRGTTGTLRSPAIAVGADTDTISILFWNRYNGSAFDTRIRGLVRVSLDGGTSFETFGSVAGDATTYYPERVVVPGVRSRTVVVQFETNNMTWHLDEISIVAHGDVQPAGASAPAFVPSANPVRGDRVFFPWPFANPGELLMYDFAGRLVLRRDVPSTDPLVQIDFTQQRIANGVYVVVARAGRESVRLTLYVVR